jgi:hypothetical protein
MNRTVAFINHTPYQAGLFSSVIDHEQMLAIVVVKATYRFARDGTVMLDRHTPFPIYQKFHATELGQCWPDVFARKRGAEVLVFGRAISRGREPTRTLEVGLRVGEVAQTLRVFGRRVWRRRRLKYVIEGPEWFDEMPLAWDRAYGGRASVREQHVSFPDNPRGKGYVLDRFRVDGTELPNLEDPTQLIRSWRDQPGPLAFSPIPPGSALIDADDSDSELSPELSMSGSFASPSIALNIAHPRLRTARLQLHDLVQLSNMCEDGWQQFRLWLPFVFLDVRIGTEREVLHCNSDTLVLFPDEWRYAVVARRAFRCRVAAQARCVVQLLEGHVA